MRDADFKISSYCHEVGCVAVAHDVSTGGVRIRSSRVVDGPILSFSSDEWVAFLAGVRNGEFDLDSFGA